MNNKGLKSMLIILVVIILVGAGAFYYLLQQKENANKEPTIDDILKNSVDVAEFTTNLSDSHYVKMSFKIQTNSKDAAAELTKRDFQVRNIVIEELSDITEKDLQGKVGKVKLEKTLKDKINEVMRDGKVEQVYITESLLQ
jgi:flagellar FliL protein